MFGVLVISACMHERSFKRSQITVSWMLNVGQHKGFYHRVEPVAVIKLNCLNKAFECQAVEWQNERLTHFKDQRKGESLDGNTEGSLPCYLWHSQRKTVVTTVSTLLHLETFWYYFFSLSNTVSHILSKVYSYSDLELWQDAEGAGRLSLLCIFMWHGF